MFDKHKFIKIVDNTMNKMLKARKTVAQGIMPPDTPFLLFNLSLNYNRLIIGTSVSLMKHVFATKSGQKTFSMLLMDGKKHSIRLKLLNLPKTKADKETLATMAHAIESHGPAVILDEVQFKGLKNSLKNLLIINKHYDHNIHDYNIVAKLVKEVGSVSVNTNRPDDSVSTTATEYSSNSNNDSSKANNTSSSNGIATKISTADVDASPREVNHRIKQLMLNKHVPVAIIDDANSDQIDHNVVAVNLKDPTLKNSVFTSLHNYDAIYNGLMNHKDSVTIEDPHYKRHSLNLKSLRDDEMVFLSMYSMRQALKAVYKDLSEKSSIHEMRLSSYIALNNCLLCMTHLIDHYYKNKSWLQDVGSTYTVISTPLDHIDDDILIKKSTPALNNYNQMRKKHEIASVGKNMSKVGSKLIGTLNMSNKNVSHIIKYCFYDCPRIAIAVLNHKPTVTIKTLNGKSHHVRISSLKRMHLDRFIDKDILSDTLALIKAYKNFHIVLFDNDQITSLCIISDIMTSLEYRYGSTESAQACNMLHYILHSVYNCMFGL